MKFREGQEAFPNEIWERGNPCASARVYPFDWSTFFLFESMFDGSSIGSDPL